MNVFRQHRERTKAKAAAVSLDQGNKAAAPISEQMRAQMSAHKVQLKAVQSMKGKAELKTEFLPIYAAYVEGVLSADVAVQDDIVMTCFIWALDAGDYDFGLNVAAWALENNIEAPPEFTRDVQTILIDEITSAALKDRSDIESFSDHLNYAEILVSDFDMPDQVRAKLLKALSWSNSNDKPRDALRQAKEALDYDPRAGVKKHITALEKTVADLDAAEDVTGNEE